MNQSEYYSQLEIVRSLIVARQRIELAWDELVTALKTDSQSEFWVSVQSISVGPDVANLESWLLDLLASEPPSDSINGLWFGLFNPTDDAGQPTAGLYLAGADCFSREDHDWPCGPDYWPDKRYADSQTLHDIYRFSYAEGGPGVDGEYLCLWGTALLQC